MSSTSTYFRYTRWPWVLTPSEINISISIFFTRYWWQVISNSSCLSMSWPGYYRPRCLIEWQRTWSELLITILPLIRNARFREPFSLIKQRLVDHLFTGKFIFCEIGAIIITEGSLEFIRLLFWFFYLSVLYSRYGIYFRVNLKENCLKMKDISLKFL